MARCSGRGATSRCAVQSVHKSHIATSNCIAASSVLVCFVQAYYLAIQTMFVCDMAVLMLVHGPNVTTSLSNCTVCVQLPQSDYLTCGRRKPGMVSPAGDLSPLDPATMVIEISSLGVGTKNTKRFTVLNPTGIAYGFVWEQIVVPGREDEAQPVACCTRRGAMAPGRRYEMEFEFLPKRAEAVEAFWHFRIPSQVRAHHMHHFDSDMAHQLDSHGNVCPSAVMRARTTVCRRPCLLLAVCASSMRPVGF